MSPLPVQVLIACHSSDRQLSRAVASVLEGNVGVAQVSVIAHNIPAEQLARTLPSRLAGAVNWLELRDGSNSPANPYNFGLKTTKSDWVSFLGSDDYLQPGAIRAWLRLSGGSDAVLTRLTREGAGPVQTPPTRPHMRGIADPIRDRLYYRSAPLGLLNTSFLRRLNLEWEPNLPTGGDLRLSTLAYTYGSIRVQRCTPGYIIGEDAGDRVTMQSGALENRLAHLVSAWGPGGWALSLPARNRRSLAVKYLRIHIFGAAYYRTLANNWLPGDRGFLAASTASIVTACPEALSPLSRADRKLLDLLLDPDSGTALVNRAAQNRRNFASWSALLPRDLRSIADREAPPRFIAASALSRFCFPGAKR